MSPMQALRPVTPNTGGVAQKICEDRWNSNPPQVTSYLSYSTSEPSDDQSRATCTSPNCGFGWRFQFKETFHYQTSSSSPRTQELVGQMEVTFQPYICSSMSLHDAKVNVKVSYPADGAKPTHENEFADVPFHADHALGIYAEPPRYRGQAHIEITITFNPSDHLALPTTSSANTKKALHQSLEGPSFVDTKFYLFSAKVQGEAAIPRAVYAKSLLLSDSSTYLRDLLSPETSFASGTPCDLRQEVPEEIAQLNADAYDYDSDSDLEDVAPVKKGKGKAPAPPTAATLPGSDKVTKSEHVDQAGGSPLVTQDGRAFAINGTAYKTWKAFVFYTYTNEIRFNKLKSQAPTGPGRFTEPPTNQDFVSCSPKSMYRLADYADLPELKILAKEGIRNSLTTSNIITELFSTFTSQYREVTELEVDYLVNNFTPGVARDLDNMLQSVVSGTKPRCFCVLAFAMRRLRGEDTQSAWWALGEEPVQTPSSVPPFHMFSDHSLHPGERPPPTPEPYVWDRPMPVKKKKKLGGSGGLNSGRAC